MKVLIVEDEYDIAANIGDYLESHGHMPDYAYDGVGGLHLAFTQQYDAIVLDIMLPRMNGLRFCESLRQEGFNIPVLMLTARDTLEDKLAGFRVGTDDYLVKPFALQELCVRLEALVRRHQPEIATAKLLKIADLELNPATHQASRAGQLLKLNPVGLKLLKLLMEASPNTVSRSTLEQTLWQEAPPESDALRSHLYALRQAVDKPFEQALIHTVHGIGYRLVAADSHAS